MDAQSLLRRGGGSLILLLLLAPQCLAQSVSLFLEEGKSGTVWDLARSRDGNVLYSCGRDSTAKAWNLKTGEGIRTFRLPAATLMTSLALGNGDATLVTGDMNGILAVWEPRTGTLLGSARAHGQYITDLAMHPRDGSVLTAGRDDSIHVWDAATLTRRRSFSTRSLWVNAFALSPDGTRLLTAGQDGSIRLWDPATGAQLATLGLHSRFARAVAFHPDGMTAFSAGRDGVVKVWDLRTRTLVSELPLNSDAPHAMATDPGTQLIVASMNGLIEVWDWKKQMRTATYGADSYGTMALTGDPRSGRLCSAHSSGLIKVWNGKDGTLLANMIGFSDGQWLSFTTDGYYDCSSVGDRYVQWKQGEDLFPVERYEAVYKKPDVLESALGGSYVPTKGMAALIPPPTVLLRSPRRAQVFAFGSEPLEVVVDVDATDARSVERIELRLNDRLVPASVLSSAQTLFRASGSLRQRFRVPVLPGRNRIEAIAWNASRVKSEPAIAVITVETDQRMAPNLYVLAVGIDQYAPAFPNLTFSSVDAQRLADQLALQEGGMYTRVYNTILMNGQATRDGILKALDAFPGMRSEDILVLFFSGHGVRSLDAKGRLQYYFVTSGATRKQVARQALSWEDVSGALSKVKAGRVILFLDACHSGEVSSGASNEKVAAALSGKVGIIFASSSGNEFSFENPSWGQGAFTKALLAGMKGEADYTKNAVIDWNELQLFVTNRVKELTRGSQNPMIPRLEQFANFDFLRAR